MSFSLSDIDRLLQVTKLAPVPTSDALDRLLQITKPTPELDAILRFARKGTVQRFEDPMEERITGKVGWGGGPPGRQLPSWDFLFFHARILTEPGIVQCVPWRARKDLRRLTLRSELYPDLWVDLVFPLPTRDERTDLFVDSRFVRLAPYPAPVTHAYIERNVLRIECGLELYVSVQLDLIQCSPL